MSTTRLREETGKPGINFRQVGPGEKAKLSPLMKHYGKMAHPFTACVRDNRKRFGDRAERVCAVLKDLIRGTTKWRSQEEAMGALLEAAGGDVDLLVEMYRDDLAMRLDAVIEQIGPHGTLLVLVESSATELHEEIVRLAGLYRECPGEPNALTALIDVAEELLERPFVLTEEALSERVATERPVADRSQRRKRASAPNFPRAVPRRPGATTGQAKRPAPTPAPRPAAKGASPPKPTGQASDSDFEGKHPRGKGGTPVGGKFVAKGSGGAETEAVQKAVGAKVDGIFGDKTKAKVERFQKRNGLTVDGVVGRQTASALLGNRKADKLNTGAIKQGQLAKLRKGGGKVREERAELLLELSLGGLARKARDYSRVGAGHDTGGQFSKQPVAAIGKALAISPERRQARANKVRRSATPEAKQDRAQARTAARLRPKVPTARGGLGKPTPKSEFAPGGRGEKIGQSLSEAEKAVVDAVRNSQAFKDAAAEMEKRGTIAALKKEDPGSISENGTQKIYGGNPDQAHRLYPDDVRARLHAEIIRAVTQGTAPTEEGQTPDVLFMAGGGASGKSSILRAGAVQEPDRAALLNADVIKECLPEFDALRFDPDDETAKLAAAAVHEESSDVVKRVTRYAQLSGGNYVVDGTGDSAKGKFRKALDDAAAKGGDVRVTYATLPVETAVDRAEARFEGAERRYVPTEVLYGAHRDAAANFFDIAEHTDYPIEIYDTSTKPPTLVFKREKGEGKGWVPGQIKDKQAFDRFAARSKGERDWLPTSQLAGRDLLRAVDSGRVKVSELSPSQMKDLQRVRQEAKG